MKLYKHKNGKIEYDNFFAYSAVPGFIGSGIWHRDGQYFYLDGNNELIERKINYENFVLIIKKENFQVEEEDQKFISYIADENGNSYGIQCDYNGQKNYHKLIFNDNFITVYSSDDEISWENLGGCAIDKPIIRQGFKKNHSTESVRLLEYTIYSDPFITIEDLNQDQIIKFYDENNNFIKETKVGSDRIGKILLDTNMKGYFEFYETELETVPYFTSEIVELEYGSHYVISEYDFDFIYNNKILNHNEKTMIDDIYDLHEIFIQNNENYAYTGLLLSIDNNTTDVVEISYDNSNFSAELDFEIDAKENKKVYLRIIKGNNSPVFNLKDFVIKITKK